MFFKKLLDGHVITNTFRRQPQQSNHESNRSSSIFWVRVNEILTDVAKKVYEEYFPLDSSTSVESKKI